MTLQRAGDLDLQVASDIICPWCFIGKRSLDQALTTLTAHGVDIKIEWLPFQLNPNLPAEGMDRKAFRTVRFGSWDNALAMDARVTEAGSKVGADFRYERQTRTSNTLAAHSLARLALAVGGSTLQTRVVDALFAAYFTEGEDVGDYAVLNRIAGKAGMVGDVVSQLIPLQDEIRELDEALRASGLKGVPSYLVDGKLLFSGSQDVDGYVRRLTAAARR